MKNIYEKLRNNIGAVILITILGLVLLGATYINVGPTTNFGGDVGVPTGSAYYINNVLLSIDDITTEDLIVKADFKDEDWGDVSVSTNSVTLDAEVVDSAQYIDGSIDHEHLAPDVISGLADVTSADADYMLIWDDTDSALKKVDMGEVRGAGGGYTNLTEFVDQTAWRVFYSNTAGDVVELALGADGTYLKSNGAAAAPTFATPAGGGDVSKVGTPADSQIGVWTGDGTIEGAASLTYDGSNLQFTGDLGSTGTKITKGWFTDMTVANAIAGDITGNAATVTSFTPAGGSLILSGADALTLTTTAATDVTLPTTGILATLAGNEVLTNKDYNFVDALGTDHFYSGELDSQPVGENVVFGDLLYFNWATVTGIDIAFVDGGAGEDTITQVAAKFLEIGLVAGDVITVSGTTNNNGNHTIVSVVAGTINVATGTLVAEGAGASVTITSPYEWKKAKADVFRTTPATRIALETKANAETCLMLVKGYIRDDSAFDFGASKIFLNDDTAGTCDDTAPAESGDQIQVVGTAKSADILFFNPSTDVGEI